MVYIVLGATHPNIVAESGEAYRNQLLRRVHELGIRNNVIFVNRFVDLPELCEYLGAAEIYVTPYLNEAQMTSGTLAYAMGTGKAIVSTPYWHAKEVLADGRGRLVPFRDSAAMAKEINSLLDDEALLNSMRKDAYNHCRPMVWKRVAQDYLDLFADATDAFVERRHAVSASPRRTEKFDLPEVDLRHLRTMTDDCGIFQHAKFTTPDRDHGYCTDDNARGLIVAGLHWDLFKDDSILPLLQIYLSFMSHAWNEEAGRFRNFMS